jgi:hypothetical protein
MNDRRGAIAPGAQIGPMIFSPMENTTAGVRASGFSLAYGLVTAVFGSTTLAVVHSPSRVTDNRAPQDLGCRSPRLMASSRRSSPHDPGTRSRRPMSSTGRVRQSTPSSWRDGAILPCPTV